MYDLVLAIPTSNPAFACIPQYVSLDNVLFTVKKDFNSIRRAIALIMKNLKHNEEILLDYACINLFQKNSVFIRFVIYTSINRDNL